MKFLARLTGMAQQGLGQMLEPIQSFCLLNKIPALSSLVVGAKTGTPGKGFIAAENVPLEQAAVVRVVMAGSFAANSRRTRSRGNAIA